MLSNSCALKERNLFFEKKTHAKNHALLKTVYIVKTDVVIVSCLYMLKFMLNKTYLHMNIQQPITDRMMDAVKVNGDATMVSASMQNFYVMDQKIVLTRRMRVPFVLQVNLIRLYVFLYVDQICIWS